jgi:hypothetical protein
MKTKINVRTARTEVHKAVRIATNTKARALLKPAARLKEVIWRGLDLRVGATENFREKLHRIATAPFRFNLPGLRAGKA